jgi:RNA polymerase sigma factor (sigma-70 family)
MEIEASEQLIDIERLSSQELICHLKQGQNPYFDKRTIFNEFHKRFAERFYKKCLGVCIDGGFDNNLAEDIFQEAFIKLLKGLNRFVINESYSEKRVGNTVVSWFGRIANNEFINYLRKFKPEEELLKEYEEIESTYIAEFDDEINVEDDIPLVRVKLREAMATLTERERYILLICANYGCLGNSKHLPDDVIQDICKQYSITKNHIKVLRFRAYNKIRSLLLG